MLAQAPSYRKRLPIMLLLPALGPHNRPRSPTQVCCSPPPRAPHLMQLQRNILLVQQRTTINRLLWSTLQHQARSRPHSILLSFLPAKLEFSTTCYYTYPPSIKNCRIVYVTSETLPTDGRHVDLDQQLPAGAAQVRPPRVSRKRWPKKVCAQIVF